MNTKRAVSLSSVGDTLKEFDKTIVLSPNSPSIHTNFGVGPPARIKISKGMSLKAQWD